MEYNLGSTSGKRAAGGRFEIMSVITLLIMKSTISSVVIGFKKIVFFFLNSHLPSKH